MIKISGGKNSENCKYDNRRSFVIAGIVMIAGFSGITFLSVAFVLGILFMAAGIFGCLSYRSYREDSVDKTWVLVDGMTTFCPWISDNLQQTGI